MKIIDKGAFLVLEIDLLETFDLMFIDSSK
jgi:hypothetical protein